MATIDPTQSNLSTQSLNNLVTIVTWAALASLDDGKPVGGSGWADRSAQIVGTFDGGTAIIEGSNNGVDYETLNDPFGVPISVTSAGVHSITEVTQYIRPRTTGGGGAVAIDVILLLRRVGP